RRTPRRRTSALGPPRAAASRRAPRTSAERRSQRRGDRTDARPSSGSAVGGAARAKQTERARVAVQERVAVHGPDLSVAKESAERHLAEMASKGVRVVIHAAIEVFAPSQAGEKQRA